MKHKIVQTLEIPEGTTCKYENYVLKCQKDSVETSRKIDVPEIEIKISNEKIDIVCNKGNKNHYKIIMTLQAHIKNLFAGLNEKFVYKLEAVNVHFPMSIKAEGNILKIDNYLGEKVPRFAKILPNVEVKIEGQKITIESNDREAAGQTAANFEKATRLKGRDRRIYQDGIFITEKPQRLSRQANESARIEQEKTGETQNA